MPEILALTTGQYFAFPMLIGGGVVMVVASNWQRITRPVRRRRRVQTLRRNANGRA